MIKTLLASIVCALLMLALPHAEAKGAHKGNPAALAKYRADKTAAKTAAATHAAAPAKYAKPAIGN